MINIYTSVEAAKKDGKRVILSNDMEFISNISPESIDRTDIEFIRKIDNARMITDRVIETPYGTASLWDISTGCKTLINLNHLIKDKQRAKTTAIRVTECGENALIEAFKLANGSQAYLLLERTDLGDILDAGYTYNIEGFQTNDIGELIYRIGGGK